MTGQSIFCMLYSTAIFTELMQKGNVRYFVYMCVKKRYAKELLLLVSLVTLTFGLYGNIGYIVETCIRVD